MNKTKKIHTQRVQNQINIIHRLFNEVLSAGFYAAGAADAPQKTAKAPNEIIFLCSNFARFNFSDSRRESGRGKKFERRLLWGESVLLSAGW